MSVTQQQVVTLLENVLFETPTQATANAGTWLNNSAAGSVQSLASAMANSGEAKIAATVVGYYLASLGRAPNAAEVQYYVAIAEQGLSATQIAAGQVSSGTWDTIGSYFAHSPEFGTRGNIDFSLGNTAAYLEAVPWLYQSVLGRTASSAELAYYDAQVVNGTDLGTLFREFTASPEFHSNTDAQISAALASFGTSTVAGTQPPAVAIGVTLAPTPTPTPSPAPSPAPTPTPTFGTLTTTNGDHISDAATSVGTAHTYAGILGAGATLNASDILTGNGSATLDLTDSSGTATDTLPGATISGVPHITLETDGNAGGGFVSLFDVGAVTGLTDLTITSSGTAGDYIGAGSAIAVTVTTESATVDIENGASSISLTDNSLTSLFLEGSVGVVTLHDPTAASTSLTVSIGSASVAGFTDADNQITDLTIAGNGGSASTLAAITDTALVTLTVTGSTVTLGTSATPIGLGANVATVDLSGSSDLTGTNYFTVGSNNVAFTLTADTTSIDLNGHTGVTIAFGTTPSGLANANFGPAQTGDTGGTIISDLLGSIAGSGDVEYGDDGTDTYIVESQDGTHVAGTGAVTIIKIAGIHGVSVVGGTHLLIT